MTSGGPDVVAQLADKTAIGELTALYNRGLDEGHAEEWAGTFTDDGALVVVGRTVIEGRDALAAFIRSRPLNLFHVTTNAIIRIEGDSAVQELALLVFEFAGDRSSITLQSSGRYTDELARGSDGWRFTRRTLTLHVVARP